MDRRDQGYPVWHVAIAFDKKRKADAFAFSIIPRHGFFRYEWDCVYRYAGDGNRFAAYRYVSVRYCDIYSIEYGHGVDRVP